IRNVVLGASCQAYHFIEGRQGRRQLRTAHRLTRGIRPERTGAARIACVLKAELRLEHRHMLVDLPAGSSMHLGTFAKHAVKGVDGKLHLVTRPCIVSGCDMILPQHVIMAMDADFKASVSSCKHRRASAFADVGRWQQSSVAQGLQPVVCCDGGAKDLAEETGTKDAT